MRKKRTIGDSSFPVIRQFFFDIIRMLDESKVWVTEDRRPNEARPQFDEVAAYHFIVQHQPLGARRTIGHTIAVDVLAETVTVDSDVLQLAAINPGLYERFIQACLDRCVRQETEPPNPERDRLEGKRTLRRLTREFDRNIKPFRKLAMRLGHQGNRIACGRHRRPAQKQR